MKKNYKEKIYKSQVKTAQPAPNNPSTDKLLEGKSLYIFLGVAALLVLIVFRHFLFFDSLYLYKDIGSDTVTYWWPHWVQLSEYIRTIGIPQWSFKQGVGQNIYAFGIGDPFSLILCLMNKDSIPYAIIFMEIVKIIGGGLFFYLYLRMLNLSLFTCIVGGLLYSFSGYMILGSGWYIVSTEALYASIVLYTGERFLRHGTWYLLPIPFFLLAALQPFYLYLYGLLLTVYCIARVILIKQFEWKNVLLSIAKMGALALFGVLLSSFVFFSNMQQLIQNPRVTGDASMFSTLSSTHLFQFTPSVYNLTALYRLFSNDLAGGAGSNFKGVVNYLEAPILYVGLVSLLLAPQAFLFFEKRKRTIYLTLTALCLIPMVFVYFRYMFWLFSGDFYRTYTLFLSLLMLYYALKALNYIDKTNIIHTKTLFVSLLVLLFLLFYSTSGHTLIPVNKGLRNIITFFLLLYAGFIYLMGNKQFKTIAIIGLSVSLCVELAYFSKITVNDRVVVKTSELKDRQGYNDYSLEAIDYVKSKDQGFYRINKNFYNNASMFLTINDPQIQNFYGITVYAEWNQFNYSRFLREMQTNTPDPTYAKWLIGPADRILPRTILNVKYLFFKPNGFKLKASGYDSLCTFGDVTVARNDYYLPFGYSYKKYIPLSEFRNFNTVEKDETLLNACVIEDEDIPAFNDMQQVNSRDNIPPLSYAAYRGSTNELRKDSLNVLSFGQNDIKGSFKASEKKLLFLSIPYDKGWHYSVDGKEAKAYKINIGFTGLLLDKGEHTIEMHFKLPFFALGVWTSLIALVCYILAIIKYRKRAF